MDRIRSIMAAVKKELKAKKAFIAPKALQELSYYLDQKTYYEVEVLRDVCDAAKLLCLEDGFDAPGKRFGEYAEIVFGDIRRFGNRSYEESEEDPEDITLWRCRADFDFKKSFIVVIERLTWYCRDFNRDTTLEKSKIVIYAPEAKIDQARVEAAKEEGWIA